MSIKKLDTHCPTCQADFVTEVEIPDLPAAPANPVRVAPPVDPVAIAQNVLDAVHKEGAEKDAQATITAQEATILKLSNELDGWRDRTHHLPFDPENICPNCKPKLDAYIDGLVKDMTPKQAHERWPHLAPPSFEFPDLSRKAR